ncbi:hypothetical protein H2198_006185 [Neophaeococcomyces mojaviensis]|uniref:Uncharacterized protein n=1 Tax=Neophaeococcomyces mojaviensis TaxID=3383035 RepID=A0ACC3A3K7_9EURO|nr:hypothetical protein H2198_006185 [Knufia sp. JES_112]
MSADIFTPESNFPWLLYAYPWMPYPRRVSLYLSEKRISSTAIQIVHVSDPQAGNCVVPSQASKYPPRPAGSLPILAIPPSAGRTETLYIRQSMAIINFLEEQCAPSGELKHVGARELVTGKNVIERARLMELLTLAEELTVSWNSVRTFGTKAGTMVYPAGAKEMLRWVHRTLHTINDILASPDHAMRVASIADDEEPVSVADIVLYQFLEFVDDCYGVDVTKGSGDVKKDVYGREVKETYIGLEEFYEGFKKRRSAERNEQAGEVANDAVLERLKFWYDGVLPGGSSS